MATEAEVGWVGGGDGGGVETTRIVAVREDATEVLKETHPHETGGSEGVSRKGVL